MIREIFRKWFSKQDKDCSPDSKEEEFHEHHDNLKAYIVLGVDATNEIFVAVQFADGEQLNMAELMFLMVSGSLMEDCIKSLRRACGSDEEAQDILKVLAKLVHDQALERRQVGSGPVIDPTEVFHRGEKNEYKG